MASDVERIIIVVEPLIAPESTFAPENTVRGTGSPLMLLRSSVAEPDSSVPSTGTISPGSTSSTEPSFTWSTGTVVKWPLPALSVSPVRCASSIACCTARNPSESVAASVPVTPGNVTTCACCGAALMSAVRLPRALDCA